jgi:hypothetical protein
VEAHALHTLIRPCWLPSDDEIFDVSLSGMAQAFASARDVHVMIGFSGEFR